MAQGRNMYVGLTLVQCEGKVHQHQAPKNLYRLLLDRVEKPHTLWSVVCVSYAHNKLGSRLLTSFLKSDQ